MRRTTVAVTAAVTAVLCAASPAAAAPAPWRIDHAFTPSKSHPRVVMAGLAAVSASQTWVGGWTQGVKGHPSGVIWHRTGSTWHKTPLPAPLNSKQSMIGTIDASSATNVWALAGPSDSKATYLLHWTGKKWAIAKRWTGQNQPNGGIVAYGSHGVWVFGQKSLRFDGRSWHTYQRALQQGTRAGSQVWALTVSNHLYRFSSGHWHKVPVTLPTSSTTGYGPSILTAITASSTRDVWLTGQGASNAAGDFNPGGFALHWNGKTWKTALVPGALYFNGDGMWNAQADGKGGVWTDDGTLHYTGGHWVKVALPKYHGKSLAYTMPLARVPGTHTVLSIAWTGSANPWMTSLLIKHS